MIPAPRSARRIAFAFLALVTRQAHSQTLTSASGASLSVSAPTEAEYDALASSGTGNYAIATTCTGTGPADCRLFLQYGSNPQGQLVGMEYAIVSLSANCQGAVANANSWFAVNPATVVLSTQKNRTCNASFRFRVSPLAYNLYVSPAPGGAFKQQVRFLFTRP
jgi:hypothetical protein